MQYYSYFGGQLKKLNPNSSLSVLLAGTPACARVCTVHPYSGRDITISVHTLRETSLDWHEPVSLAADRAALTGDYRVA